MSKIHICNLVWLAGYYQSLHIFSIYMLCIFMFFHVLLLSVRMKHTFLARSISSDLDFRNGIFFWRHHITCFQKDCIDPSQCNEIDSFLTSSFCSFEWIELENFFLDIFSFFDCADLFSCSYSLETCFPNWLIAPIMIQLKLKFRDVLIG